MRKVRFLGLVICCILLVSNLALAAPKAGAGNAKNDPTLINMDIYKSIYTNKVFSVSGSRGDTNLNTSSSEIDANSSTNTWEYDNADWKEIYSYLHNEEGKFMLGYESYSFDSNLNDYVLTGMREFQPPVKIFPKGQIDPYDTWGGIYSFVQKDAGGNIIETQNQWREYRFCGYEDVTVPYGTFKDALKVRRLRIDGGLSNYWYVPEIGMIKSENIWRNTGFMEIHELVSTSY